MIFLVRDEVCGLERNGFPSLEEKGSCWLLDQEWERQEGLMV